MEPEKRPRQAWKQASHNEGVSDSVNKPETTGYPGTRHTGSMPYPYHMAPNSAAGTPGNFRETQERPLGVPVPPPNFQFPRHGHFPFIPPNQPGFHGHLPPPFFPPPSPFFNSNTRPSVRPPPGQFNPQHSLPPVPPPIPSYQPPQVHSGTPPRPPASNSEQDFDVLKRRLGLSETKLEHVRSLLNNVLDRCNQADMAHAKQWILEHCQDKRSLGELFQAFRGLKQDKKFETTLRTLYLANDLLFHELKHSSAWIKVELWPHLVPLAREAASLAGPEQREHLTKLVELWSAQKCLSPEQLVQVRAATQALEARSLLPVTRPPFPAAPLLRHPPALVPYHKVPAGVMVELSKDFTTPYTPIPVRKAQFVPMLPPDAAMNLAGAINEFYEGMDKGIYQPNQPPPSTPPASWQPGFLDKWQAEIFNRFHRPSQTGSRSSSRSRSRSRSRSVRSYSSRSSRSPSSFQRSRSPRRGRSYSRSRSYSSRGSERRDRARSYSRSSSRSYKYSSSRSPEKRRSFRR